MIPSDSRTLDDSGKHKFCVYASRKNLHKYCHSHEDILRRYKKQIVMCEQMPELMWETMGNQMYTACFSNKNEVQEFIKFVHDKEL